MKIKICGIRTENDVNIINKFQPDYAGFVFAEGKRQVTAEDGRELIALLSEGIKPVGVFVNEAEDKIIEIAKYCGLYAIQLHGDESGDYIEGIRNHLPDMVIIKNVPLKDKDTVRQGLDAGADYILFDTYDLMARGGTGKRGKWKLIAEMKEEINLPFFIAGGINVENLEEAAGYAPYGADASSSLEGENGYKDYEKIREFIKRSREL